MNRIGFIVGVGMLMGSVSAQANDFNNNRWGQERVVLNYYDTHVRSRQGNNVLMLKRKIRQELGYYNPGLLNAIQRGDLTLKRVRLVAKSKGGRGSADLIIGGYVADSGNVNGHPYDFNNPNPRTFDRVNLNNYSSQSQGRWQIHLRGNIIVRKVVLILESRNRWDQPPRRRPPVRPLPPRYPNPPVRPLPPRRPGPPVQPRPPRRPPRGQPPRGPGRRP